MKKSLTYLILFLTIATFTSGSNHPQMQLYYKTIGKGKTVLTIHGGPGMDSSYFMPYLLQAKTFSKLVLYDQRGCGKSLVRVNFQPTLSGYVDDIELLRKTIGSKKIILLAHSFGSILAIKYAIKYPDNVRAVIIVSGYARKHPDQYKYFYIPPELQNKMDNLRNSRLPDSIKQKKINALRYTLYFHRKKFKQMSFLEHFSESITFNQKIFSQLTHSSEYLFFDERNQLKKLKIPFLILCGKFDIVTPPFLSSELKSSTRFSEVKIFNQSGHFPFIEETNKFIKTLKRFITRY